MSGPTNIQWTQHSWNPIVGCSIVSPGCTNCYAMKMAARLEAMAGTCLIEADDARQSYYDTVKKVNGRSVWTGKIARAPDHVLLAPLHRKKPTTYFVNSMGDLFHEKCPDEWIDDVLAVAALCPQHTFQILTKRADRMRAYLSHKAGDGRQDVRNQLAWVAVPRVMNLWCHGWTGEEIYGPHRSRAIAAFTQWPLPNVWLGVSTERQQEADERIPHLLQTPAAVRFISAEPLLGPIDLTEIDGGADRSIPRQHWTTVDTHDSPPAIRIDALEGYRHQRFGHYSEQCPALDWVIVGGESGPNARPMHPDWARSLRDQCASAGIPMFFKQWGVAEPVIAAEDGFSGYGDDPAMLREAWRSCTVVWPDGRTERPGATLDYWNKDFDTNDDADAVALTRCAIVMHRVGKKSAGRLLDGIEHNAMPKVTA